MSDALVKRGYADGKYVCSCRKCEGTFMGDKRAWCCKGCAVSADRIEELIAERDEAWKRAAHAEEMWGRAEVKLSKAVLLIDDLIECGIWYGDTLKSFLSSRAELTGGKDE